MYNNEMENKRKINPIILVISGLVLVGLIFLIYSLTQIFRKNQFGDETRIDNFSQYFNDVPQNTKDSIFANLYAS